MTRSDPYFADVAALMGDPGRANILAALMDGRARTAKELACIAGVSPQTTSGHLAKLSAGALIEAMPQGRNRYYRLREPLVARAVEGLMALAQKREPQRRPRSPSNVQMRLARTCYDHLAGKLGVAVFNQLVERKYLRRAVPDLRVSKEGQEFFAKLGIEVTSLAKQRRGFARPCLDWSERTPHLAGALGGALACRCFEFGWIERIDGTRAIRVSPLGRSQFRRMLGVTLCEAID